MFILKLNNKHIPILWDVTPCRLLVTDVSKEQLPTSSGPSGTGLIWIFRNTWNLVTLTYCVSGNFIAGQYLSWDIIERETVLPASKIYAKLYTNLRLPVSQTESLLSGFERYRCTCPRRQCIWDSRGTASLILARSTPQPLNCGGENPPIHVQYVTGWIPQPF